MLRHQSLIPLSHQHQHGLALCVQIERGLGADRSPETTAKWAKKVADAFEVELRNHFDVEERILFPAIREALGPAPLVEALVGDHRKLESLVERVTTAGEDDRPGALLEFTALLSEHIRREERELFEDIQNRLPADRLQQLGESIARDVVRVCL